MRTILLSIVLPLTLLATSVPTIEAQKLSKVCKTVRRLTGAEIWKSKQSAHIPSGDVRKNSTAFIVENGTKAPRGNCLYAYDKNGNLVHKLGTYARGNGYSIRMYGGWGCGDKKTPAQVAALAIRNTKSPAIYVTTGTGNCALIIDPRRCFNSSGC